MLTDGRIRAARVDEDLDSLTRQLNQYSLKSDVIDAMRKTVDLLE
jgi:hypothetical protein